MNAKNKKRIDALFVPLYKRDTTLFTHGKGCYLYDNEGKSYLDFGSGIAVNALGHANPKLQKALLKQGNALLHLSNLYYTPSQIELAELLVKHTFGNRVYFCNSGTEANEAAIKFARKHMRVHSNDKFNILSFSGGFHGRTYGALSATAQQKFHAGFDPLIEGFYYSPFNDIEAAKKIFETIKFAAVIVEPLQGEGGVNAASKEFITFLRNICTKHNTLLIFDEIQCGMGRTGTLWNYEQYKVKPDIMTLAKPLGGGLPLGAVITTKKIAETMSVGDHGSTFGGNPVACAVGAAALSVIADKKFLMGVRQKSAHLLEKLNALQKSFSEIESVIGKGLLLGVRLKSDPTDIITACKNNGLLLIKAGQNTIRFIPPLTVKTHEIDKAVKIFTSVMKTTLNKG